MAKYTHLQKIIITTVLTVCCQLCFAQDYRLYHRLVNNAERCFFMKGNTDSACRYYDAAFSDFDFVFAKDCFMAAQIAYSGNDSRYKQYLKRGFSEGLRPDHMLLSTVFARLVSDSDWYKHTEYNYTALRAQYLNRINQRVLKKIIECVEIDQNDKNGEMYTYSRKLAKNMHYFELLISFDQFPSDKVIGISHKYIMSELGVEGADYHDSVFTHHGMNSLHFYDESVSQANVMPLLLHHICTYRYFERYWDSLIISGQAHPRDVALLYDNELRLYDDPKFSSTKARRIAEAFLCKYEPLYGGYKINPFVMWRNIHCGRAVIDSMRSALYINKLEVDSVKECYGECFGWKVGFGFEDCR